jgi:hypothetical protein
MENKVSKADMAKALPHIIAVDFDGTLVYDEFPEIGRIKKHVWDKVKHAQAMGNKVILWTSRDNGNLQAAVDFCTANGLIFDAVNENLPEVRELFNNDTRKVYADEYWDDKAIGMFCDNMFA